MIIDCIADLHGHYPVLEGGDLLIVAGDLTARDTLEEHLEFVKWCGRQHYGHVIYIAGNHDNLCLKEPVKNKKVEYLFDSGTEFDYEKQVAHPASTSHVSIDVLMTETKKIKIWGSPWTKTFPGMNPHCMAFTCDTEEQLAEKFAMIPNDIDILITHSPPYGILDQTSKNRCGSTYLLNKFRGSTNLKLHVFGHIHENGGKCAQIGMIKYVNASHVNEHYEPVNKPIRVIL